MRKLFLILNILGVILLTGCFSSSPGKKYFQLHIDETSRELKNQAGAEMPGKILLVESVSVEDMYNDYRIVYRSSPYQLNYYSYNFWIKKPDKIIRDAIYDYLQKSKIFKNVISRFTEGEPDYLLKARVDALEEYDLKPSWYAHLKMEIEITDFKTGKTVVFYRFDKRKRLTEKKVEKVPLAISKLLKEELAAVIGDFLEKVR